MSVIAFFAGFLPVLFFVNWLQHRHERQLARLLNQWWGVLTAIIIIAGVPVIAGILAAQVML